MNFQVGEVDANIPWKHQRCLCFFFRRWLAMAAAEMSRH
jgi:hypothetical protein